MGDMTQHLEYFSITFLLLINRLYHAFSKSGVKKSSFFHFCFLLANALVCDARC